MIPLSMQTAPEKAPFGSPCNGCGYCCAAEVCVVGQGLFGKETPAPCPALEFADGRFWCGAVRVADGAGKHVGMYLRMRLGIGVGCDTDDPEGNGT